MSIPAGTTPPAGACVYYIANGNSYSPYNLNLDRQAQDWASPANFAGFFPAGPYGMEGDWGPDYPMAYIATWDNPGVGLPTVQGAQWAAEEGRIPPGFWDDRLCQPSAAYWDWERLTAAPDELARNAMLNDARAGGFLGRVADAIEENVPTPKDAAKAAKKALNDVSETLGEMTGRLLAAFTEAAARGSARGVTAFWDELPAAGQAAIAIGALVLAIAAVRKLT